MSLSLCSTSSLPSQDACRLGGGPKIGHLGSGSDLLGQNSASLWAPSWQGVSVLCSHTSCMGSLLCPEMASLAVGNLSKDTPPPEEDSESRAVPCISCCSLVVDSWAPPCQSPAFWSSGVPHSPLWGVGPSLCTVPQAMPMGLGFPLSHLRKKSLSSGSEEEQ